LQFSQPIKSQPIQTKKTRRQSKNKKNKKKNEKTKPTRFDKPMHFPHENKPSFTLKAKPI